jgi:hypothetical protein
VEFRAALLPLALAMFAVSFAAAPAHAAQPSLSIDDVTVTEQTLAKAVFHVTLDKASDEPVTVEVTATPGPSGHFSAVAETRTFEPGVTSLEVWIFVRRNNLYEPPRTYAVTLSEADGAQIGDGTGTLTVLNTDQKDDIRDCRATTAHWTATGERRELGVANPAGAPCQFDRQVGPSTGTAWTPWIGGMSAGVGADSWNAFTIHGAPGHAESQVQVSEVRVYPPSAGIQAESVDAEVEVGCTLDHTTYVFAHSSTDGLAYAFVNGRLVYLVDERSGEHLRFVLPDGTVVETNRTLRTTSLAGGELVHHVVQQAVVVTAPDGTETVIGEVSVSYGADNCAI